jgi:hypothetical protein
MPGGSKDLRKIQLGQEVTAGTPVAATALWRGMGTIKDDREIIFPEEQVGILGGTLRSAMISQLGALSFDAVGATFQQLAYPFNAGVEKLVAGVADGAGSDYIYTFDAPTTAQNTIQPFTIEGGDDVQAEEFDYGICQKITIAGEGQGLLTVASDWVGREVTDTTFTPAISIPSVEDIIFNSGKIFIDDSGGTVGTTQVSALLRAMSVSWTTGLIPWWAVDGSLDFNSHKFAGDTEEIKVNMTYEHIAAAVTEKAKYRAKTIRLIQLLFEGSAFGTGGTTYSNHTFLLNLAGIYTDWDKIGEIDGNDVVEVEFTARYSVSDALKAQAIVVNELATVT